MDLQCEIIDCSICTRSFEKDYNAVLIGACEECNELMSIVHSAMKQARIDGLKYAPNTWRNMPDRSNTEHALTHIFKYNRKDTTEDHIAHAICNLVFEYARKS